ncbi:hypothetical protein [Roseobacter sp. HKCCD7870]|uniref:hypothetical protein n=1 Tax=Roseobacter sp. HKCCD7870 TaxID=3120343 RepID=UPI0030EF4C04
MSRDERTRKLQFIYKMYKDPEEGGILADFIRIGGATNIPWPAGMAEDVADLIDKGDPWTKRKQTAVDDGWIFERCRRAGSK